MKKSSLIFLSLLLLLPCSCKRYSKKDIVGVWMMAHSTNYPNRYLAGLNNLNLFWYQDNDTVLNASFSGGIMSGEVPTFNDLDSELMSGTWKVSGDKVYRDLGFGRDTLIIESLEREKNMAVISKTGELKPDTLILIYLADDINKALLRIKAMYSIGKKASRLDYLDY